MESKTLRSVVLHSVRVVLILVCFVKQVNCGCPVGTPNVASMCRSSTASGSSVAIDTSGARATQNITHVPVCTCSISIKNAVLYDLTFDGQAGQCGSFVKIGTHVSKEDCLKAVRRRILVNKDEISDFKLDMDLRKRSEPFVADYCVKVDMSFCEADEYQCTDTGRCLPERYRCDSSPDCDDENDEEDCGLVASCGEGMTPCKSGNACFTSAERCDNVSKCADGSDEFNCGSQAGNETLVSSDITAPIIDVTCYESAYFTTTTTSTTTSTTTPTTTTTTSTTTTRPTTTTTPEPTTTTTPEPTTTTTQTTTPEPTTTTTQTQPSSTPTETAGNSLTESTKHAVQNTHSTKTILLTETSRGETDKYVFKQPYVITGIVLASILIASSVLIAVIMWKKKRRRNRDAQPDLWATHEAADKEL